MNKKFNKREKYRNGIAVVPLIGAIVPKMPKSPGFGSTNPDEIIKDLELARDDHYIKAIILPINSPGGSPVASEEIADAVKYAGEVKPVIGLIRDIGASGGYLVGSACSKLVARETSIVGSIGVLFGKKEYYDLMNQLGVRNLTFKAGENKDMLSPWREMSDEEKKLVQNMVDTSYEHFINIVATNRGLETEAVRQMATGWIYLGQEAKKRGLIDYVGNKETAIRICEDLESFKHDKIVEKPERSKGLLSMLMGPRTMQEMAYHHGRGISDSFTGGQDTYISF